MSRRFTDAEALRWLEINLAVDYAISEPRKFGVADLVTPKSWAALFYLHTRKDGVAAYSVVRDDLTLGKNVMTRVTKVLERAGYVARGYHPETGGSLLKLTTDGRDALGKVLSHAATITFSKNPLGGE